MIKSKFRKFSANRKEQERIRKNWYFRADTEMVVFLTSNLFSCCQFAPSWKSFQPIDRRTVQNCVEMNARFGFRVQMSSLNYFVWFSEKVHQWQTTIWPLFMLPESPLSPPSQCHCYHCHHPANTSLVRRNHEKSSAYDLDTYSKVLKPLISLNQVFSEDNERFFFGNDLHRTK